MRDGGPPITPFQFVAAGEPRLTGRLVRSSAPLNATVVIDLEDALWDVSDEQRTRELKDRGRRDLLEMARANPGLLAEQPLGVRLNRLGGPHARADLEALGRLPAHAALECVVAPKVERAAELQAWQLALERQGIRYRQLVPIVETVRGLANLDEILDGARAIGIEWIVYGHYDYGLDAGNWPFSELDDEQYWNLVTPLVRRIEDAGFRFVQPPFFHLAADDRFAAILERLARVAHRPFGAITLGRHQTALACRFVSPAGGAFSPPDVERTAQPTVTEKTALARAVVDSYQAHRRQGASFAMDSRSGEFISPHLYLAAVRHLGSLPQ